VILAFVLKHFKLVAVGLAALAIAAVVYAGYRHVEGLKGDLVAATSRLAVETLRAELAVSANKTLREAADAATARLSALEDARRASTEELNALRAQIRNLTLEEDMTRNADEAVRTLNARNRDLNRLLERESRAGARPGRR